MIRVRKRSRKNAGTRKGVDEPITYPDLFTLRFPLWGTLIIYPAVSGTHDVAVIPRIAGHGSNLPGKSAHYPIFNLCHSIDIYD